MDLFVRSEDLVEDHKVGHNQGLRIVFRNDQMVSDWAQRTQFEDQVSIRLAWLLRFGVWIGL